MGMKSTGLSLNRNAITSGLAHIDKVRGANNWGSNYVFSSGGLKNDMRLIFPEVNHLITSSGYAQTNIRHLVTSSGYAESSIRHLNTASGYLNHASKTNAIPSGGLFVKAGNSATGYYKVFFNTVKPTAGAMSGYIWIVPA